MSAMGRPLHSKPLPAVNECNGDLSSIYADECSLHAPQSSGEVAEPAPGLRDRSFENAERDQRALFQAVHAVRDR